MTKKELSQIYHLNQEVKMWQHELDALEYSVKYKSPEITGMPPAKTNLTSDPAGRDAVRLIEEQENIQNIIKGILAKIQMKRKEVLQYIDSIEDDSLLRQIIFYRSISCMTWSEVAAHVGGDNTADSVRMIFNRQFDREK